MNLYNVKNIKDLPQLEQILPGNYLVVENFTGTSKLDFDDFVIGPRNTSFANQVFNDILALSAYSLYTVSSQISSISASTLSAINTFTAQITSLSGQTLNNNFIENTELRQGLIKMGKKTILIDANSQLGSVSMILPLNLTMPLQNSDINVAPTSINPIGMDYIWYISNTVINTGSNTATYTITISTNTIGNNVDREFGITVITI